MYKLIINEMKTQTTHESNSFNKAATFMVRYVKIFCFLIIFTATGVVFTSCGGGYVTSEPRYDYYDRPLAPSERHIWIDGDWIWNSRAHIYEHKPGYWVVPREGSYYREGHWETSPRGKFWSRGYWEKSKKRNSR